MCSGDGWPGRGLGLAALMTQERRSSELGHAGGQSEDQNECERRAGARRRATEMTPRESLGVLRVYIYIYLYIQTSFLIRICFLYLSLHFGWNVDVLSMLDGFTKCK